LSSAPAVSDAEAAAAAAAANPDRWMAASMFSHASLVEWGRPEDDIAEDKEECCCAGKTAEAE
jgi:hypothetical protein